MDFSTNPLNIVNICNLAFIQDFNGNLHAPYESTFKFITYLLVCQDVNTFLNLSEGALAKGLRYAVHADLKPFLLLLLLLLHHITIK